MFPPPPPPFCPRWMTGWGWGTRAVHRMTATSGPGGIGPILMALIRSTDRVLSAIISQRILCTVYLFPIMTSAKLRLKFTFAAFALLPPAGRFQLINGFYYRKIPNQLWFAAKGCHFGGRACGSTGGRPHYCLYHN